MIATKKLLSVLFTGALAASASAADYYVASDGTYDGAPDGATVYASLDEAIAAAGNDFDVIYAEPGTYTTKTEGGPNLRVKLIGTGTSRDKVVIKSGGQYRTLRMAANSWLENVTVVGEGTWAADRGGAIEMFGGTVTNCVIRDGKATAKDKQAGGNLFVNADTALVVDCEISGGEGKNHGGSVCLLNGTIRGCTITGGVSSNDGEKYGANIYMQNGLVDSCTVSNGTGYEGGEIYMTGGTVTNCTILANGVTRGSGGGIYMTGGTVDDCYIDGTGGKMSYHGGCIYMRNGTVRNSTCTNGVCTSGNDRSGGNVYMENGTLENVKLLDGTAASQGGNLYVNAGTIRGLTCEDGKATGNGGNVYMKGAATIVGGVIRRGTATSKGGNVYMGDGMLQDLEISGGVLTGNVGDGEGGGNIFWNNGRISRCSITGGKLTGTTSLRGGGINCVYTTTANVTRLLEDCLLAENENAAIFCNRSFATYNCSFINNAGASVNSWNSIALDFANCVIFGNTNSAGETHKWTGNRPVIKNVATDDDSLSNTEGYVAITASDFADYANGDYRPAADGALVDAGVADVRADASDKDLDGNPRVSGKSGKIDIGCYEYQKRELTVRIESREYSPVWAPSTVTFTHATENSASPENMVFTYDFGDGTTNETTAALTIDHAYAQPGIYTVRITATNECEEESAEMTYEGYVRVASSTVYVQPGNAGAAFPYDTPETGYGALKMAIEEAYDGYTLLLGEGTYGSSDQVSITKALTVKGLGTTPERVILRNTVEEPNAYYHRTLEVNNAGAWIENLTIADGCVKDENGGNLRLVSGVVSNCVIRNGRAVVSGAKGNAAGAGVALTGAAILTHCIITNNAVEGTSANSGLAGGAVFVPYGAKDGRLSNSLIAYNRYVTSGDTEKPGAAGVRFGGDNNNTQIENNTIVSNVVEGAVSEDSAGVHCTTWYGRLRNNIIAGNYETGKGRFTSARIDLAHCTFDSNLTDVEIVDVLVDKGPVVAVSPSQTKSFVAPIDRIFMDFASGDFMIGTQSAARNKGTASGLALTPSVDLLGKPRVFGKAIDIGCYECQRKPGGVVVFR